MSADRSSPFPSGADRSVQLIVMISIRPRLVDFSFPRSIVDAQRQAAHGAGMQEFDCAPGSCRGVGLDPSRLTDSLTFHLRIIRWGASLLLLSIISVRICWAGENRFSDLIANSPFGMSSSVPVSAVESTIELRGYVEEEGALMFSLARPDAEGRIRSAWVGLDEPFAAFVVRSFDQTTDTVQVEHRGQRLTLKLKLNRVRVLQAPERLEPGEEPVVVADDKARLEAISAEIRRRRALRQANADETSPR